MWTELAHAKVNLNLRVLAREDSGFHQIETLFCSLELADLVEVSIGGDVVTLDVTGPDADARGAPDLGPVERNLAVRAAVLFNQAAAVNAVGVHIRLVKRIPTGAGLGGGSSNAAAVLRALNRLHGEPLATGALLELGARLGSDVPYFLSGAALAVGWGRGGRLMPLPSLEAATVLLAVPPHGVPTADAYAAFAHTRREAADPHEGAVTPALIRAPAAWRDAAVLAHNDFEPIVFQRLPRLRQVRDALATAGAAVARLTGTGSVVFGVFENAALAERSADRLEEEFDDLQFIRTRTVDDRSLSTEIAAGKFPGVDSNHH